jgi:hypothetical protein
MKLATNKISCYQSQSHHFLETMLPNNRKGGSPQILRDDASHTARARARAHARTHAHTLVTHKAQNGSVAMYCTAVLQTSEQAHHHCSSVRRLQ